MWTRSSPCCTAGILSCVYNVGFPSSLPAIYRACWAQQPLSTPATEPTSIFRTEITPTGCAGECLLDPKRKSFCCAVSKDGTGVQWAGHKGELRITLPRAIFVTHKVIPKALFKYSQCFFNNLGFSLGLLHKLFGYLIAVDYVHTVLPCSIK